MTKQTNVLVLDISGSKPLRVGVDNFFAARPVSVMMVTDVNLFRTLSSGAKRFDMAVCLVNSGNNHLVKGKNLVPTFVFQTHTYTYKKMMQFYMENGGGDG